MSVEYLKGYAIRRNNTCDSNETKCTKDSTWGNFQACCPGNSFCFDSQTSVPNFICCDNHNNCTESIAEAPTCADKSWNLFDWDGYFCCDKGESAFHVNDRVLVGCSGEDFPGNDTYETLDVISSSSGTPVLTSTATSSSSPSASSSPSSSSTAKVGSSSSGVSSHTNTGAIAGGVVGGVVGAAAIIAVLFLLIRRRKQQSRQSQEQMRNQEYGQSRSHVVYSELGERLKPKELDGQARSEIGSGGVSFKEPQELPVGH